MSETFKINLTEKYLHCKILGTFNKKKTENRKKKLKENMKG